MIIIYIRNSGFCEGIFIQIPGAWRGFWKSPRAARRARGAERRPERGTKRLSPAFALPWRHGVLPEGIFKIPEQAMGICLKIPDQKPEFRIYFFDGLYNSTQCFAFTRPRLLSFNCLPFRFSWFLDMFCLEQVLICFYYQNFGTNMKHRIINSMMKILLPQTPITIHILMITLNSYYFQGYYQFSNIRGFWAGDFKPGILSRGFWAGDFKPGISEKKFPANPGDFTSVIP